MTTKTLQAKRYYKQGTGWYVVENNVIKASSRKNALKVLGFDCGVFRLVVLSEKLE